MSVMNLKVKCNKKNTCSLLAQASTLTPWASKPNRSAGYKSN